MMQMRRISLLLLLFALLGSLTIEPVWAGGWAALTLEELPADVVDGRPFTVRFAVRQHGRTLMSGLSPMVTAVHQDTGQSVSVEAAETNETGIYAATLTLPAAGTWRWTIEAFTDTYTMPPLTVMAAVPMQTVPAPATPVTLPAIVGWSALLVAGGMAFAMMRQRRRIWLAGSAVALLISLVVFGRPWQRPRVIVAEGGTTAAVATGEMGEALFVAKGCIQCHQNGNVTMARNHFAIGPNLTNYHASAEFLRMWLADPASVKPETLMPDLNLSEAEIEALVAFLAPDGS